ncbi:hypothetical protein BJ684DRAFT_10506 [Piptocephalis cylindrospora]|uniref:Rap-GAP domain-containing protein n=1 Tax=Piptocephalis cylindrospora TaxID=1907219 RepID=A0A4P9Y4N7_9FUNG|nr:hypothetical protein BJ684DRAFT_10506 [Piptocephalis cylindrospora]|eukprot:RKP13121.1 hypothetical protein BJ684DRAFT_10506 [Piptocephalis cylindrospora]
MFLLQEREKDIVWYKEHFYGRPHYTYLSVQSPLGPLIVSLIADPRQCYRALIRSASGSVRISLPASVVPLPWWRRRLGLPATESTVLAAMTEHLPIKCLRPCGDGRLPKEILRMEERMVVRCHKFGIGYVAPGQDTEKQMLSNDLEDCSPGFLSFLSFLGKRVPLQGWKGYSGGLDCKSKYPGYTGKESVYTMWNDYEIMLHVAPFLPKTKDTGEQYLGRKKHLGNDIVLILYQEDPSHPFRISTIRSKQNHIICLVCPHPRGYCIRIFRRREVPHFEPFLPPQAILEKNPLARDFFFYKLIQGERSSYKTPAFSNKISRTRKAFLQDLAERFLESS